MSKTTLKQIKHFLDINSIPFNHLTHKTIPRDSLGASIIRGTNFEDGAKALILETKSGKIIQAVVPANFRIDIKKLKKLINEKNLSLVSPDTVLELTGCVVGSVPPFGILWKIPVYFDKSLLSKKEVVFSAGTKEDSILIDPNKLATINEAIIEDIIKE